jgi:membrane protease subunit (stomatin/prohibitin family)
LIGETMTSILDLPTMSQEVASASRHALTDDFERLGLELLTFQIMAITPPEEVQKRIDERSGMAAIGDMNQYIQFQTAQAIGELPNAAAAGGGGGGSLTEGAGLGAGLGMGMAFGQVMRDAVGGASAGQQAAAPQAAAPAAGATKFCPNCGHGLPAGAKFCPNCGNAVQAAAGTCPNCGAVNDAGAKFCAECGTAMSSG